jgi:ABC-2 type transport system ATP-binding protein
VSLAAPREIERIAAGGPTPGVAVRIDGLGKRFDVRRSVLETLRHPFGGRQATALADVSLEIREGEFFGLLGPNGAGKTTLFKILSTLILPDNGSAKVKGFDVVGQPASVRRVLAPATPDERSLNWRLSARENLRSFAALHGMRGRALSARLEEVLELVELADTGEKLAGQFSSGMRQRLLIARALLSDPAVLLLDEPTRSLDPLSARRLRVFLREELATRRGCTILLATHSAEEALHLCDRVGVLHGGRLLRVGPPDRLQEEFRDEDYRVWVRQKDWDRFVFTLSQTDVVPREMGSESDWIIAQFRIAGGLDAAAEMVAAMVRQGILLARVEAIPLSIADLMERIVSGSQNQEPHV